MGWIGALGGLGEGLQDYSKSMEEQRKLQWKAQQDQVQSERQINLENLRASNNRQAAQESRSFQSGENQKGRDFQVGQTTASQGFQTKERVGAFQQQQGATIVGYLDDVPVTKTEAAQLNTEDAQRMVTPEAHKQKGAVDSAVAVKTATQKMDDDVKAKSIAQMKETEWYQSSSPAIRELAELNMVINGKLDLKSLLKAPKDLEAPDKGQLEVAMQLLGENEMWANSTAPAKLLWVTMEATKIANPGKKIMGDKVLPQEQIADVVEKFMDGKVGAADIMQLNMESQQRFFEALRQVQPETATSVTQKPLSTLGHAPGEAQRIGAEPQAKAPGIFARARAKNQAYLDKQNGALQGQMMPRQQ